MQAIENTLPEILLIPLLGHTQGHCGVAIREKDSWLLHAGDAYFYHEEMNVYKTRCTPMLKFSQALFDVDRKARLANQKRLRHLIKSEGSGVRLFCSHDPQEFRNFQ